MPSEGLMLVRGQIDLDINRRVKKLREGLGERLNLGEDRSACTTVYGRGDSTPAPPPGEARMIVHKAAIAHDPEHGVPLFQDSSDIGLVTSSVAPGPVSMAKLDSGEVGGVRDGYGIQQLLQDA